MSVANPPGKVVGEITGHQGPVRVVRLNGTVWRTYACMSWSGCYKQLVQGQPGDWLSNCQTICCAQSYYLFVYVHNNNNLYMHIRAVSCEWMCAHQLSQHRILSECPVNIYGYIIIIILYVCALIWLCVCVRANNPKKSMVAAKQFTQFQPYCIPHTTN